MFKKLSTTALLLGLAMEANASLVAGDVMFTAFNADEDGWALAAFNDIAPSTTIYFTDNEVSGSTFNTGESYFQWTSGASTIAAGSVIRFSSIDTTSLASSLGTLSRAAITGSTNYGLSQTADTIYAYLGSSATAPTTFLSAISSGAFSTAEGSLTGTGLSVGVNAIQLQNASDFAEYNGFRNGMPDFASYQAIVANVAYWDDKGDGAYAALVPNTTHFTVAAVPVPAAVWLFSSAIAALGLVRRKK